MSIDGGLTWVDADTVTGPYLNGATVAPQFKFVVTNTGNVPLSQRDGDGQRLHAAGGLHRDEPGGGRVG